MNIGHSRRRSAARLVVALAGAAVASVAIAGGRGGGGGDSSMNPYTGDSYAYFNGGHNRGEQGTIRPGGVPPPTGWSLWPQRPTRNDVQSKASPTVRFAPAPERSANPASPDTAPR